jgi:hypothetical protein
MVDIEDLGVRRITIVCYRFLDSKSGRITAESAYGLESGPSDQIIRSLLQYGHKSGIDMGILPLLEVDNPISIGHVWRGSVRLDRGSLPTFFDEYYSYISTLADIACQYKAARLYIGSELVGLTKDQAAIDYWRHLVHSIRRILGPAESYRLSYAANHDEVERIQFWDDLDEIGVDAYYPLASTHQASGPSRPSEDVLDLGVERMLTKLKKFSTRWNKRITISEWGAVPFDLTSTQPWNWQPSRTVDVREQADVYRALLRAIANEYDWLSACDIWHWRMRGNEGSPYGIDMLDKPSKLIKRYSRMAIGL